VAEYCQQAKGGQEKKNQNQDDEEIEKHSSL
jgi:hypothetical protein